MLTLSVSSSEPTIHLSSAIWAEGKLLPAMRWIDPLLWALHYDSHGTIDRGWYYLSTAFGLVPQTGLETDWLAIPGFKPRDSKYTPTTDREYGTSILDNLYSARQVFSGKPILGFCPEGEHNTSHLNLRGSYDTMRGSDWLGTVIDPSYGATAPWWITPGVNRLAYSTTTSTTGPWTYEFTCTSTNPLRGTVVKSMRNDGARYPMLENLEYHCLDSQRGIRATTYARRGTNIIPIDITYSEVDLNVKTRSPLSFDLSYVLTFTEVTWNTVSKFLVQWSLDACTPSGVPGTVVPVVGTKYPLSPAYTTIPLTYPYVTYTCIQTSSHLKDYQKHPVTGAPWYVGQSTTDFLRSGWYAVSDPWVPQLPQPLETYPAWLGGVLGSYGRAWNDSFPDIRLSALQSCADALDNAVDGLQTNMLENISELREIQELVPDLTELRSAIRHLVKRRYLASIKDVVDFATSMRLQGKFGIEPTIDLVVEILPRLSKILTQLSQSKLYGSDEIIGRGSYSYDFPLHQEEFPWQGTSLVTRSKVCLHGSSTHLTDLLLGGVATGTLPVPSNAWDMLPLSFVADWFFNIGGRLSQLEALSYLSILGVRVIVNSFELVHLFDELDEERLPGVLNSPKSIHPAYVWYKREVTSRLPSVRSGKFDFPLPSRGPSWLTAGSLAWQLLLG